MQLQFHISTALRVVAEAHVAEILRDAGTEGKHVKAIAQPKNLDPSKLARILRLLATHHVFVEVAPNIFANNRLSTILDTGKSVESLIKHPEDRFAGTQGIVALLAHTADDSFKTSAYLPEVLFDPAHGHLSDPDKTAFNRAFKCDVPMWTYFEAPGNEARLGRFGHAMDGVKNMGRPDIILSGFDWKGLPKDSLVVDVGGGIGSQAMTLAQHHPHLKFVVQDRAPVVKDAVQFWNDNMPGVLKSGRVELQGHDFFDPQPVKNADIFLLSLVLHDWSDALCISILQQLRAAATPSTRVVIRDNLMLYACAEDAAKGIPGAAQNLPPAPLLPNRGQATAMPYFVDMQMMGFFNGMERTFTQVKELMAQAGWRVAEVHHGEPFQLSQQKVVGVPM
ncbi:S-adenosyl-L-methionine-dependent methyltransferase [Artomyces pyxidatus]|uniref:S-adenosyl-L-methionine-dependent methyltransferase n=1 Tax=Artomyces pyxidatus TaxID=48021 RepID=A0ACB8SU35_9AGAM|nr:S-adenosyl-L-methionine-dependent methyltransferase [Artomyces pyxidatus]